MMHIRGISRRPVKAQSICDDIDNEYQAMLCFLMQLLTQFFLPLSDIKSPSEPETGTE